MEKKLLTVVFCIIALISLSSCGNSEESANDEWITDIGKAEENQSTNLPDGVEMCFFTGLDPYYVVYDTASNMYGIWNAEAAQYALEAVLTDINDFDDSNMAWALKDGYWGCIDPSGEKVIGFMFDDIRAFINDRAIVRVGDLIGVIDRAGNYVLDCKYVGISFKEKYIEAVEARDVSGLVEIYYNQGYYGSHDIRGLYTYDGDEVIYGPFSEFQFIDEMIFACIDQYSSINKWYYVYDGAGNQLLKSESKDKNIVFVSLPQNGIIQAYNQWFTGWIEPTNYITYLNLDLEPINNVYYKSGSTHDFNQLGLSIGRVETYRPKSKTETRLVAESGDWVVVRSDGTHLCSLPFQKYSESVVSYIDVNEYYVLVEIDNWINSDKLPETGIYLIGLTDRDMHRYKSIEMIDGTNCVIVQEDETNLYGMYDGSTLQLPCIYNSIVREGDSLTFSASRGAEITSYTSQHTQSA